MSSGEQKKEESIADIVKEYGVAPFAASVGAVLVGKELFMVNEEVLVMGIFGSLVFYSYTLFYDSINETFDDNKNAIARAQIEAREAAIATLTKQKEIHQHYLSISSEIEGMAGQISATATEFADAVNNKNEQSVVNDLEGVLNDLYETKTFIADSEYDMVLRTAGANLQTYLDEKLPQKQKDEFFQNSVQMLEGKGDAAKADFVKSQFRTEVQKVLDGIKAASTPAAQKKVKADIEAKIASGEISLEDSALKTVRNLVA